MAIITRIQRFGMALFFVLALAGGWSHSALATSVQEAFDTLTPEAYELTETELITSMIDVGSSLPNGSVQPPEDWTPSVTVQRSTVTLINQDPTSSKAMVHHTQQQVTSWATENGRQTTTLLREWTETLPQADAEEQTARPQITTDDSAEIQCVPLPISYHDWPEENRRPLVLQPCLDSGNTEDFLGQQMESHGIFLNT